MIPGYRNRRAIAFRELPELDVRDCPVLLLCADGAFPAVQVPALLDYCRRGGTLIFPFGLPLYYDHTPEGGRTQINDRFMKEFHIGWSSWWLRGSAAPKTVERYEDADGFPGLGPTLSGFRCSFTMEIWSRATVSTRCCGDAGGSFAARSARSTA
ncbi:MAG: hypothetical protein L6W00_15655 [Lentisphaeria bacterium]|nr:MAG: hypothetical protein L6W00_15655 [Lentisphaeria bacterium]